MNRTIGLLLSFMVMMLIAVTVLSASTGFLSDFGDSGDNIQDTGCNFQQGQNADYEDLSDDCKPESEQDYHYGQAYSLAAGGQSEDGG
ncbi:MAG: hypothetical protein H8Z69_01990 [Nanohaloarchaea archaeon]|nr:hypothetical protein [Candidatus Nanohaloarchaea archaeon]